MATSRAPGVPGLKQVPCQQGKKMLAENSAFGEGAQQGVQDPRGSLGFRTRQLPAGMRAPMQNQDGSGGMCTVLCEL